MTSLLNAIGLPGEEDSQKLLSPYINDLILRVAKVGGLHKGVFGKRTATGKSPREEILEFVELAWNEFMFRSEPVPPSHEISIDNLIDYAIQQRMSNLGDMHSSVIADLESGMTLKDLLYQMETTQMDLIKKIQTSFDQHKQFMVKTHVDWFKTKQSFPINTSNKKSEFCPNYQRYINDQTALMGFFKILADASREYPLTKGTFWNYFYLLPDAEKKEEARSLTPPPESEDEIDSGRGSLDDGGNEEEEKEKREENEKEALLIIKVNKKTLCTRVVSISKPSCLSSSSSALSLGRRRRRLPRVWGANISFRAV